MKDSNPVSPTTGPKRDQFWRGVPRPVMAWATLTREGEILVASVRERSEDVKLACGECVPFRVVITFEPAFRPDPGEYTAFEQKLAQAMNKEAFSPHEENWAKDEWHVFLPHARVAIRALIEMGVSIGR